MKVSELITFFRSLNQDWMNPETTVDTLKAGDPETEIHGIAVAWQSYTWALKKAVSLGCNVFLTHEPTFYHHRDQPEGNAYAGSAGFVEKKRWIEDQGLAIYRCHDLWDQMPQMGITDSWAELLGLSQVAVKDHYYQVYEIPEMPVGDFAKKVLARLQPFGQTALEVIGPMDRRVRRVGIGTGAVTSLSQFVTQYQVDLAICTDDGFLFWRDGEFALDQQIPVIIVNHAVSEEMGIKNLSLFLKQAFPAIPIHYIFQGCPYRLFQNTELSSFQ